MRINVTRQEGLVIISIIGRIDNFTSAHFEHDINILVKTGVKKIVLDFSETTHMSVLTIRFLKKTVTQFREMGGEITMICPHSDLSTRIHTFINQDAIPLEQCEL